jgi:hypothetical protein
MGTISGLTFGGTMREERQARATSNDSSCKSGPDPTERLERFSGRGKGTTARRHPGLKNVAAHWASDLARKEKAEQLLKAAPPLHSVK